MGMCASGTTSSRRGRCVSGRT
uniref:Uncharacterized protein n=1 Tax=Arundo donax TaxID=35708 RepID=A0A0A9G2P6_ARUDO